MTRSYCFARRLAQVGVIAGAALAARSAAAQDAGTDGSAPADCSTLGMPNPIWLSGSSAFENTVKYFAVKMAALSTPMTVFYATPGSCVGVDAITNNKDLTGTADYYTISGSTITINSCPIPAGQKADVGISDVFYDSCSLTPAAQPSTLGDFLGPAQAMLFVVPKADSPSDPQYSFITALEAQDLFGCSSYAANTGGINMTPWTDPTNLFCRDANSGTQITIAKSINLPASAFTTCVSDPVVGGSKGSTGLAKAVYMSSNAPAALGFISEDTYDANRTTLNSVPFQAFNQNLAYYADSSSGTNDRANVRDGHYVVWGYEHMFAPVDGTGTPTSQKAADFIGYITGKKTDSSFDYISLEGGAGTIPLCAMKVQRSTDGGLLSYSTNTDTCGCAFESAVTMSTPSQCVACGTGCASGTSCHHGFCE